MIGKEVPEPALRIVSGLDDEALAEGLKELIGAGFLYEAEIYPERVLAFSHPLTREVAYGSQLGQQRATAHAATARAMIELNPDRHDELAALIAQHLEQGGETLEAARWNARAAHWAGYSHPQDAIRLWGKVTELASELPESEETAALGVFSRLLQLDYAWRLGMETERVDALVEEAREIAARTGDLRSLTLLRFLESARPGLDQHASEWTRAVDEAIALADESGDEALRVGDPDRGLVLVHGGRRSRPLRATGRRGARDHGRRPQRGKRNRDRLPVRVGDHGQGDHPARPLRVRRRRGAVRAGPADRGRAGRPRDRELDPRQPRHPPGGRGATSTRPWGSPCGTTSSPSASATSSRDAGRWSTSGCVRLERGDAEGALDAFERGDRLYREAMGKGGEAEAWREALIAEALVGVGRVPEGLERAERAVAIARERGLLWALPRALRTLAQARIAAGAPGAGELLDEAEEVATASGRLIELKGIERVRNSVPAARA